MFLHDLWLPRLEVKRQASSVDVYLEPNLLIVIGTVSGASTECALNLLNRVFDVSDLHGLAFEGLVYSRTYRGGGIVDVECWRGLGKRRKEEITTQLVSRPAVIMLLLVDPARDDHKTIARVEQAASLVPNVTLLTVSSDWVTGDNGDELLSNVRGMIDRTLSGSDDVLAERSLELLGGYSQEEMYVPSRMQSLREKQNSMNQTAFAKYREMNSGSTACTAS